MIDDTIKLDGAGRADVDGIWHGGGSSSSGSSSSSNTKGGI